MKNTKIIIINIIFFLSTILFYNNVLAYDEQYHYNFSGLGELGSTSENLYLASVSSSQNFKMYVVYESFDCDHVGDFALTINGIANTVPCSGLGKNVYKNEFGIITGLVANSAYELYLTKSREDERGLGQLDIYIEYTSDPISFLDDFGTGITINLPESFLFSDEFKLFSDDDDLLIFFKYQVGLVIFIILTIMITKIFTYNKL